MSLRDLIGDAEIGEFRPGAFYLSTMDTLIFLLEDVGYVSESVQHGDLEILWHPQEPRIVGVKIWDISKRPGGAEEGDRKWLTTAHHLWKLSDSSRPIWKRCIS